MKKRIKVCVVGAHGSQTALLGRMLKKLPGVDTTPQGECIEGALPAPQALAKWHMIHLIRDGRDCHAARWQSGALGWHDPLSAIRREAEEWATFILGCRREMAHHPACLELKYEDLVLGNEKTQGRLADFLGVPSGEMNRLPRQREWQVGRWQETLLPAEVEAFEETAGAMLDECGYRLSSALTSQRNEAASAEYGERSAKALSNRSYEEAKGWATLALRADPGSPRREHGLLSLAEWCQDLPVHWCMEVARDTALGDRFGARLPPWRGEPLNDRHRLFIWRTHRDLGADLRYTALLSNLGERARYCTIAVDARLIPLLQRRFPGLDFIPDTAEPPAESSFHASWELLGHFLMPSRSAMPGEPWLVAESQRIAALLSARASRAQPRVAIAWYSSNNRKDLPTPEVWRSLLKVRGISWVSAQYGVDPAEVQEWQSLGQVINVEAIDFREDLDGLSALLRSCDLLVSISGSQVHLAGALGVPTWVIMREAPMLSWPLGSETCGWYPRTRCVWVRDESWDAAMRALARDLRRWLWRWRFGRWRRSLGALMSPSRRDHSP